MMLLCPQLVLAGHPTLPTMWTAETIEPGAPGSGTGLESYNFVENPTSENPSSMWSNYTGCRRLIHVGNAGDTKRYLMGCDAMNCCWEEQDGNQVQFQIPNFKYVNPSHTVDVEYSRVN